jgi:kumamolisin
MGEVSLDIEMAISMAPNLTKILVYEGTNGVTSWATILTQIANDDLANQVSCSWSGGRPTRVPNRFSR